MYPYVPPSPSSLNVTPSSSPIFGPADSSPPSSPGLVPYSLDSPPRRVSASFSHPFAASTKAIKLPHYEKKTESPLNTPPGTFTLRSVGLPRGVTASRSLPEDGFTSNFSPSSSPRSYPTSSIDTEERIWEDALRRPVDTGNGQIDLSYQGLTHIPPSIGDLAGFFNTSEVSEQTLQVSTRVFARVDTEPSRTRSFGRTQSIRDSGKERHVLKLYLMDNAITSLPRELFNVKNLTVLSLRKNHLTSIPPEICLLTNLHELNISNNKLTFLPWQMRDMKIEKLMVNPNPFLPEPEPEPEPMHELEMELDMATLPLTHGTQRTSLRARRSITRLWLHKTASRPVLSPVTHTLSAVPPLTELCLRLLLSPSPHGHTALVEYYGLPLHDAWSTRMPPSIRRVLADAIPGICRPRKRPVDTAPPSSPETCPNPAHRGRAFIRHGAERFSWERRVAGVDVGGAVPLRWRGCLPGCLDFLDDAPPESDGDASLPELAVRAVDLGHVDLDMEGFDN